MDPIKERLLTVYDQQEQKGIKKYGQPLADCPEDAYQWDSMALEEAVDLVKYVLKENMILRKRNRQLCNHVKTLENAPKNARWIEEH